MLDVGCGTGAITAGIARAVNPGGRALGIDRDDVLIETARTEHSGIENLQFDRGDATDLKFRSRFDVVSSSRALQWIAEPRLAIENMKLAAKSGGIVVVLDYNHTQNRWEPEPPREFKGFYDAFLAWRQANGWDNEMADHLPELFRSVGLTGVYSRDQDEIVNRGEPAFEKRSSLWTGTLEHVAGQLAVAGFSTKAKLQEARDRYNCWVNTDLVKQTLVLRATIGIVP